MYYDAIRKNGFPGYFYRNTLMLAQEIKGIRIQLRVNPIELYHMRQRLPYLAA
jgi:hypothetical protein